MPTWKAKSELREVKRYSRQRRWAIVSALLAAAFSLQACSHKSSPPTPSTTSSPPTAPATPQTIRGTVQSLDGEVMTVATSSGSVRIQLLPSTQVAAVVPSDRTEIKDGGYLGVPSVTQPDGSQRAAAVIVFADAMRGTAEGSHPFDLPGAATASKMTNGTVSSSKMTNGTLVTSKMTNGTLTGQQGGSSLTLQYKDGASTGSQSIAIPPDVPVVGVEPGKLSDVQPGVHIFALATAQPDGVLNANGVYASKNGLVIPF